MSLKLISLLVVATIATVNAEKFYFGGCTSFENRVDALLYTHDGWMKFQNLMKNELHMVLWDPSLTEAAKSKKDITFKVSDVNVGTYTYTDGTGVTNTLEGSVSYTRESRTAHMSIQYEAGLLDDAKEMFGSNSKGEAKLYPLYISEYEAIFIACTPVFWGKIETMYVLNSDSQSLKDMNMKCAEAAVKEMTGITVQAMPVQASSFI